ncbi:hypothetical protein ABIE44_001379 [Marmoricola sp. OAE513]|uniref:SGNH hydrolase domain-containing protein n=1 Tax=Marmoricola sp. OAE513 TaxID=2817894 RepID=UPI003398A66E
MEAATDKSDAYDKQSSGDDCWSYLPNFRVKTCTFGEADSATNVVVVGNSHAGQWLPALQRLAGQNDFKVSTLLASQCALSEVRQNFDTDAKSRACLRWVEKVTTRVIAMKPDLVVMTNRISTAAEGESLQDSYPAYGDGYRAVLERWKQAGIKVLVLHDTPAPGFQIPDCIATEGSRYSNCDGDRKTWVKPEPVEGVVKALADPDIRFVDLNDNICEAKTCQAVTGGVITYFDGSHLTATYAATLAPYLGVPLLEMLGRSSG